MNFFERRKIYFLSIIFFFVSLLYLDFLLSGIAPDFCAGVSYLYNDQMSKPFYDYASFDASGFVGFLLLGLTVFCLLEP